LREKLGSDFSPALRSRLDAGGADKVVPLMQHLRAPQAPVLAGDTALDGLGIAAVHTKGALGTATRRVARFLRRK
jgi:hypothetical protein